MGLMRFLVPGLLLLALLLPAPASAITLTCGQTFTQHCDPFSGDCFTTADNQTWIATLNGVQQHQCDTDPTSCWIDKFLACPTLSPPVNPAAIRACPPYAACADSPLDSIPGYPIAAGQLPGAAFGSSATDVFECHAMDFNVVPPADLGRLPNALTCLAIVHYPNECPFAPHGMFCGPPYDVSFSVGTFSSAVVYEPDGCAAWDIRPAPQASACLLGQSATLAFLKWDFDQWLGHQNYRNNLHRREVRLRRSINLGHYGDPTAILVPIRLALAVQRLIWLVELGIEIQRLIDDPPNPNYQVLPALPPAVEVPVFTLDETVTQAQIDAATAWALKARKASMYSRQFNDTLDNLGGALLAFEAGDLTAKPWVRRLARFADGAMSAAAGQAILALNRQPALAAAFPPVMEPAGCLTPTDAAGLLQEAVLRRGDLYGPHLLYRDLNGHCADAAEWPTEIAQTELTERVHWTSLLTPRIADRICGGTGLCSSLTTTTITTAPAQVAGKIKQTIAVSAVGQYAITDGLLVTVSAPGYPSQTLPLVAGSVLYKQAAPAGSSVTLTAVFAEQMSAKLTASSATVTVVVP